MPYLNEEGQSKYRELTQEIEARGGMKRNEADYSHGTRLLRLRMVYGAAEMAAASPAIFQIFDVTPGTQIVRALLSLLFSACWYPTLVLLYRKTLKYSIPGG